MTFEKTAEVTTLSSRRNGHRKTGLILLGVACLLLFQSFPLLTDFRQVAEVVGEWHRVPGTVTESRVIQGSGGQSSGQAGQYTTLVLGYRFILSGKLFTGRNLHTFAPVEGSAAYWAQGSYPVGRTVTVYYFGDPPVREVIADATLGSSLVKVLIAGLAVLGFILAAFSQFRKAI